MLLISLAVNMLYIFALYTPLPNRHNGLTGGCIT
jgi:hypothetical protein